MKWPLLGSGKVLSHGTWVHSVELLDKEVLCRFPNNTGCC